MKNNSKLNYPSLRKRGFLSSEPLSQHLGYQQCYRSFLCSRDVGISSCAPDTCTIQDFSCDLEVEKACLEKQRLFWGLAPQVLLHSHSPALTMDWISVTLSEDLLEKRSVRCALVPALRLSGYVQAAAGCVKLTDGAEKLSLTAGRPRVLRLQQRGR